MENDLMTTNFFWLFMSDSIETSRVIDRNKSLNNHQLFNKMKPFERYQTKSGCEQVVIRGDTSGNEFFFDA